MGAFDKFEKKEEIIRMTVEIEDNLYDNLAELSRTFYDTSVNKLINAAIEQLIKTENIQLYQKSKNTFSTKRSLLIKKSIVTGLEKLKEKFDIPFYRLVNMAIRNAIDEENKDKQ